MSRLIRKVVMPVGGFGTRFLPITKSVPKEMLPLVDKPLIQYAVEEAIASGISDVILVTGRNKTAIENHFDKAYELETELLNKGKVELLESVKRAVPQANYIYTRQNEALGLGHAINCASSVVNEPFAVILVDDIIMCDPPLLAQMVQIFEELSSDFGLNISLIATEEVDPKDVSNYGIVEIHPVNQSISRVISIEEKPSNAKSNLAVIGRYILSPTIFDKLSNLKIGVGGEIQLSDAISELLREEKVFSFKFQGRRYDCGSKLGYIKANFAFACEDALIRDELIRFASQLKEKLLRF